MHNKNRIKRANGTTIIHVKNKLYVIQLRHTLTTHFQHQPFVWFPHFIHKKSFFFNSIKHTRANFNIASNVQIMAKLLKFTFKRVVLQFSIIQYTVPFLPLKMKIKFYFKSRGSKNKTSSIYVLYGWWFPCTISWIYLCTHIGKKKKKENEIMMVFQSIIKFSLNYT